jgi:nucleotide-binding universal stress UspA family protein
MMAPVEWPREEWSMFSKIVVGTDGSDTAAGAVALAADLARQSGATLHVVSAYKDAITSITVAHVGAVAVPDTTLTASELKGATEEMLAEVVKDTGGVEVHTHAVPGLPADVLISVAESVGADLIVVGSKGMKGARRLIGSVPNTVAHRSPCNVIIAKTY